MIINQSDFKFDVAVCTQIFDTSQIGVVADIFPASYRYKIDVPMRRIIFFGLQAVQALHFSLSRLVPWQLVI